ncbi:MAG: hypothetical protein FWE37_05260 [Spirochaetaceae bacterium]|nr:hypothetical protein [Spirochaetaceae bacterium]
MALFKKKIDEPVAVTVSEGQQLADLWTGTLDYKIEAEQLNKLNFITEGYYLYFYEAANLVAACNLPLDLSQLKAAGEGLLAVFAEQGRKLYFIVRSAAELADTLALFNYVAGFSYYRLTINKSNGLLCLADGLLTGDKAVKVGVKQTLTFLPNLLFWPNRLKTNLDNFTLSLEDWRFAAQNEIKRDDSLIIKVTLKEGTLSCYYHLLLVAGEHKERYKTNYLEAVFAQQRAFYRLFRPAITISFTLVTAMPAAQGLCGRGHFYQHFSHKIPALLSIQAEQFKTLLGLTLVKNEQALLNYGSKEPLAMLMHLNHQLQAGFYPYAARFYLYANLQSLNENFNPFTGGKALTLIELLALFNEQDYKLIVQNFIVPKLGNKLGKLLNYKKVIRNAEGGQKIVTATVSDADSGRLITNLPPALQEAAGKELAENEEQWHSHNFEALKQLAEMVEKRQLEVSVTAHTLIESEIIYHLHEKERKAYNTMWDNDFVPRWKLAEQKDKIRIIDKLDNRQWAEILAVKPANFEVLSKYISSGRRKFLREEIDYILQRGLNYVEANGALKAVLH